VASRLAGSDDRCPNRPAVTRRPLCAASPSSSSLSCVRPPSCPTGRGARSVPWGATPLPAWSKA